MNIQDFWPTETLTAAPEVYGELVELRKRTFLGFCELESTKGVLKPGTPFATTHGQEMIRVLCVRVLEELGEAYDSDSRDHHLEELIDAINYAMAIPILEKPTCTLTEVQLAACFELLMNGDAGKIPNWNRRLTPNELGHVTLSVSRLTNHLRNRAWMNRAQDTQFNGRTELYQFIQQVLELVVTAFDSWEEFVRFFIAKDRVLQFRLQSKY